MRTTARAIRVPSDDLTAAAMHLPGDNEFREMAVPSYCHRLTPIRRLFYRRLDVALTLAALRSDETVLDYGCGSGVLLPSLAIRCRDVYATDLFTAPSRALARKHGLADIHFIDEPEHISRAIAGPIDCVLALDVLEHISNLDHTLRTIAACLSPVGRLVVSGPTETIFYRIGRLIAGFRNEYHERNVRDILETALASGWCLSRRARVPEFPLPRAFEVYVLGRAADPAARGARA